MKLITFTSGDTTPRMKRYADSAEAFGLHPIYFQTPFYPGHVGRCQQMLPTLAKWDEDEVVCFTDAYDVLFLGGEEAILERYKRLCCPDVCLSAERSCYPYRWQSEEFPEVDGPYRYVNAGCWIARAGAIVNLWGRMGLMRLPSSMNDQAVVADYYKQYPISLTLDSRSVLCQNLWDAVGDLDYEGCINCDWKLDSPVPPKLRDIPAGRNLKTGEWPCIVHGSGGADMSGAQRLLAERIRDVKHTTSEN
jgi:hypothetical protein